MECNHIVGWYPKTGPRDVVLVHLENELDVECLFKSAKKNHFRFCPSCGQEIDWGFVDAFNKLKEL